MSIKKRIEIELPESIEEAITAYGAEKVLSMIHDYIKRNEGDKAYREGRLKK